jgi:glycosyltransferase involved in cell wall biosynthesis
MKFNPKVSIIIPVYNGANYLKEAIKSALAQTYKNIEIIVVNDGSNDDGATDKIARSFGNKIKYFKKENGGVATALNLGVKEMTGEYFSWLSHDDKYKPEKITKQIEYLSTIKDKKAILYANFDLINDKGDFISRVTLDHEMLEKIPAYSLLRGCINGVTLLIPKSAFEDYGKFDPSLRCTQDYDMWHRMKKTYKFIHIENVLTMTRIHPNQGTIANPAAVTEGDALWIRMIKDLPEIEKIKAEGSMLKFYLEMLKFLQQTAYVGALEYCKQELENTAQTKTVNIGKPSDEQLVLETYGSLIKTDQIRSASYYLENITKQMVKNGNTKSVTNILSEKLIGENTGMTKKDIENYYVSKIGKKSNKKRLMFCSGHWLTGGMERVLSIIFRQLKDEYELFLLAPFDGREGLIELPDYVTHIKMSNQYFYDNSYDHIALSYALMLDIDVVIGFMHLWGRQLEFYELCVGTRIKTIACNNEIYFYPYENPFYYKFIQKRLDVFKNVDAVLWLTNFSAASYGLANNNSYLMPNPNTYKVQENNKDGEDKIILCVGRFNDYIKRIDRILECFSIVSKRQPDARLMLVGKCDRDVPVLLNDGTTVNDLLKKFNIDEEKVMFIGEVRDVEKYYSQANLLLLASNNEGFGMVINEAACFGVPFVCSRIPGLEDLVVDGENGFLIDQGDIESMANAVDMILSDHKLHERLGRNAKKIVTKFDELEIGNKWKYLINTLLENNSDDKRNSKLNAKLSYEIKDYKKFSKVLFDETNSIIVANLEGGNSQSIPVDTGSKIKRRYHRLKRAIKTKGVLRSSGIIVKMVYRKAKTIIGT